MALGMPICWVPIGLSDADQATGTEGCNLRSSHPSTTAPTLMYPPTIPPFASTVSRLEAECTQRCAACDFPRRRRHSSAPLCECELLSDGCCHGACWIRDAPLAPGQPSLRGRPRSVQPPGARWPALNRTLRSEDPASPERIPGRVEDVAASCPSPRYPCYPPPRRVRPSSTRPIPTDYIRITPNKRYTIDKKYFIVYSTACRR